MGFNDTRLTKQNAPLCPTLFVLILCWLSLWRVQRLSPVPLSHLAGHLFQSSLPVVRRLTKQNTSVCPFLFVLVRAGCLFGLFSTFRIPFLRTTFPLGWSPVPVKSLMVRWSCKLSENLNNAPHSGTCIKLLS